ncbi:MAG: vitamin K epoxide reductase family protein [Thermoleophilia bacterium]
MTDATMRNVMSGLAAVGVAISAYLTYVHYAEIQPFCTGISNCERVQTSDWALVAGVPVALTGLIAYLAILVALRVRGDSGRLATALIAFSGLGYSAYLTWVELYRIDAICQWCIISATIMAVLAVLAGMRVIREATRPEPTTV